MYRVYRWNILAHDFVRRINNHVLRIGYRGGGSKPLLALSSSLSFFHIRQTRVKFVVEHRGGQAVFDHSSVVFIFPKNRMLINYIQTILYFLRKLILFVRIFILLSYWSVNNRSEFVKGFKCKRLKNCVLSSIRLCVIRRR